MYWLQVYIFYPIWPCSNTCKGNLVCKEIKSIVETLHKMQQALKLVTAKPHHLKN